MTWWLARVGFLPLAVMFAPAVLAFQIDFEEIGDLIKKGTEAFQDVSESHEIEIGEGVAAALLGAAPLVKDDDLQRYVNQVGLWLALQSERPELPWRFGVIESDSYNAFATPGGNIFITKGLFLMMRTESELAGVLGHEIAHVLERHHLDAIKGQARRELAVDALSALGNQQNLSQGNKKLLKSLVSSAVALYGKGLDRDDELQADHLGVVIAARAGYEPFGLPGLLLALDGLGEGDTRLGLLNSTHPTFRDRLEALDERMSNPLDMYAEHGVVADRFLEMRDRLTAR